jgi:hypothetical protein
MSAGYGAGLPLGVLKSVRSSVFLGEVLPLFRDFFFTIPPFALAQRE